MSFLDQNGEIILDCVLTSRGRQLLAKGDGSFKVTKFAVFDTEINYGLFDNTHSSGSAYYDLSILQTPILEAVSDGDTDQTRLLSISRTNLGYLPVVKLNEVYSKSHKRHSLGAFLVAVDKATEDSIMTNGTDLIDGIIAGETVGAGALIRVDQGIDSNAISPAFSLDSDLVETQFIVEIDNRLGSIISKGTTKATPAYIDDNNIASYYLSLGSDVEFMSQNTDRSVATTQAIAGPRGTTLEFGIMTSLELNTSTYLMNQIGSTSTLSGVGGNISVRHVDATVRVTGVTTGFSLDIPVRFVKKI